MALSRAWLFCICVCVDCFRQDEPDTAWMLQLSVEKEVTASPAISPAERPAWYPWFRASHARSSIYLMILILLPVTAVAFAGPKWLLAAMIICSDTLCTELPMAVFPVLASPVEVGFLVATKPLGQAIATPLTRFVRQRELFCLKLGLLLQSGGLFLQGLSPDLLSCFTARLAQGVASALIMGATSSLAREEPMVADKDSDVSTLIYSMYAGLILGTPLGGLGFSFEAFLPFVLLGLVELVMLGAVQLNWRQSAMQPAPAHIPVMQLLRFPMIWKPVLLICLIVTYVSALQATVFSIMEAEMGLSLSQASLMWLLQAVPAVIAVLLIGPNAQSIGFRLVMLMGLLVAGAGGIFSRQDSVSILAFELIVAGVALGAENGTVPRLLEDICTRYFDECGSVYVVLNLAQQAGYVLGPLLGTLMVRVFDFKTMCRSFGGVFVVYAMFHTLVAMQVPCQGRVSGKRSPWPFFELVALWATRRLETAPDVAELRSQAECDVGALEILEALPLSVHALQDHGPVTQSAARYLASFLLERVHFHHWPFLQDFCGRLLWSLLLAVLTLTHDDPLISPGYALRMQQISVSDLYQKHATTFMDILAGSPWKILQLLPTLAQRERQLRPDFHMAIIRQQSELTMDRLAPFTAVPPAEATQLERTLRVAHDFLTVLGVAYMLIAGSLLGAIRHMDRIPWDDDVDLCVDAAHEMQLVSLAAALEAKRSGLALPQTLSLRARRALALLNDQKHRLEVRSSRALTFRIQEEGGQEASVDVWL
ncbi:unnamed protein product, partial [Effrenium voratum]